MNTLNWKGTSISAKLLKSIRCLYNGDIYPLCLPRIFGMVEENCDRERNKSIRTQVKLEEVIVNKIEKKQFNWMNQNNLTKRVIDSGNMRERSRGRPRKGSENEKENIGKRRRKSIERMRQLAKDRKTCNNWNGIRERRRRYFISIDFPSWTCSLPIETISSSFMFIYASFARSTCLTYVYIGTRSFCKLLTCCYLYL